jgi:peroxiredoxin
LYKLVVLGLRIFLDLQPIYMKPLIFISLLIIFSLGCFSQRQQAEGFTVETVKGVQYDLAELRGKVVVLYFWSTSCPICESVTPKLNTIAEKYSGENVVYLAISPERKQKVENFLKNHRFTFEVAAESFGVIFKYGEKGRDGEFNMPFPTIFVINQAGEIELKTVGTKSPADVENALIRLTNRVL